MKSISIPSSQLGTKASLDLMLKSDSVEIVPDISDSEARVLAACRAALDAEKDYATKAVIAGLLLLEHRDQLRTAHTEPGRTNDVIRHNQHTLKEQNFTLWVESNGLAIATAKRWMQAAERIARLKLGLSTADVFTPSIDIDGTVVPLSQAMTAPESELPSQALKFRQGVFDFMADKSLAEAVAAAVDGESPAHRITRAAVGKTAGGHNGEDRKDFPTFAGRALAECLSHVGAKVDKKGGHWKSISAAGKHVTVEYFKLFLRGLPDDLVEFLCEASRLERSLRAKGHRPEPSALKAVIDQAIGQKAAAAAKSK